MEDAEEKDKGIKEAAATTTTNNNKKDSQTMRKELKRYIGNAALGYRRDNMEVAYPIVEGIVKDWDAVESICTHVFEYVNIALS